VTADGRPPPQRFDSSVPNAARIYDVLLGGKDNFAADRDAAQRLLSVMPGVGVAARDNRAFLQRCVRFLAREAGIRQFLDLGTGLPACGNVHEVAHETDALARVVYVDNDPMVITHANALLANAWSVQATQADLRYPRELLNRLGMQEILHLDQPLAVLMVAVLHFLRDDENPWVIVDAYKARMAPGSYLVISHITADGIPDEEAKEAAGIYEYASAPAVPRTERDITRFFGGLDMVAPGLVEVSAWRGLGRRIRPVLMYGGIGRKPGHAEGGALAG